MSRRLDSSRRQFLATAAAASVAGVAVAASQSLAAEKAAVGSAELKKRGTIATGIPRARRIAVGPQGQMLLAAGRDVITLNDEGREVSRITLSRAPRCLLARDEKTLWVGMKDHVQVVSLAGEIVARWDRLGDAALISGLAAGRDEVFVADAGNHCIWRMDRAGKQLGRIEGGAGQFHAPAEFFSLLLDGRGTLHVANPGRHRIETYDADGKLTGTWGRQARTLEGFSGCCNPVSFVRLADGRFVTAERAQPRIKLFDAAGKFQQELAGPEDFEANEKASIGDNSLACNSGGFDLALDAHGRVLALDRATGEITLFG